MGAVLTILEVRVSEQTLDPTPRNADAIQKDANDTVTDAKDAASGMAAQANQKIAAARDSIQGSYQSAKEKAADMQAAAVEKGTAAAQATGRYVKDNPWVAVGAAAAIGIAIGLLSRRR
jgi:ElaB/YqjD/DUF883 family membrane-anchored ribosome-binding protein